MTAASLESDSTQPRFNALSTPLHSTALARGQESRRAAPAATGRWIGLEPSDVSCRRVVLQVGRSDAATLTLSQNATASGIGAATSLSEIPDVTNIVNSHNEAFHHDGV